jgi:hypothetical protein
VEVEVEVVPSGEKVVPSEEVVAAKAATAVDSLPEEDKRPARLAKETASAGMHSWGPPLKTSAGEAGREVPLARDYRRSVRPVIGNVKQK